MSDVKEEVAEQEVEEQLEEAAQSDEPVEAEEEGEGDSEGEEDIEESEEFLTVQIGDEEPEAQEDDPDLVSKLRRVIREKDKKIKEFEGSLSATGPKELSPKPTLESCDYDHEEFEGKLAKWYEEKREHDEVEARQQQLQQKAEERWQTKLRTYDESKEGLGVKDYDDAEAIVMQILDEPFPGIVAPDVRFNAIKQGTKNPAMVIYALAKNTKKAQELANIEDPIEYAVALGELSASMKVTKGKAPPPEKRVKPTANGVSAADDTLERLRTDAARTGDFSKLMAYKRQKRG